MLQHYSLEQVTTATMGIRVFRVLGLGLREVLYQILDVPVDDGAVEPTTYC